MPSSTPSRAMLILLTLAFVLNHLDRHILNITLNQIGQEFRLTDLQLGTLSGLAFAVIYVLLGFPIARSCRPGLRKPILITSLGLWSGMTMLMGGAANYLQLFLARIGVGIGEAGCVPPSHSMISDAYPGERRASALGFYSAGANAGLFLSFLVGSYVAASHGWRMAFLVAGAPGILLAIIMVFVLREPRSTQPVSSRPQSDTPRVRYAEVLRLLLGNRCKRHVIIGSAVTAIVGYGALTWIATFLVRIHGMPLPDAGLYLAVVIGLLGAFGTWLGGVFSDRLGRNDPRWRLGFVALTIFIAKPMSVLFYLAENTQLALAIFVPVAILGAMYLGPAFAQIYSGLTDTMKPMATAIMMLILNLVGLGAGPVLVGFISDQLAPTQGADSLRYALLVIQVAGIWGGVHFLLAARATGSR